MDNWERYLLAQQSEGTGDLGALPSRPTRSLDDLMALSHGDADIVPPRRPIPPRPLSPPVRQAYDAERPPGVPPTPPPSTGSGGLPEGVRDRARMAAGMAQLSNFTGGLGRRGRNFRPDPNAPNVARSSVINDYLNVQRAQDQRKAREFQQAMMTRQLELKSQPQPIDPIAQAKAQADLRKAEAEATLKGREVEVAGSEQGRKAELVRLINDAASQANIVVAASPQQSEQQLQAIYKNIIEHPMQYAKARATGGIRGGEYSATRRPQVSAALRGQIETDLGKFMTDSQASALDAVLDSDLPDKTKKQYVEKFERRAMDNEKRARDTAEQTMATIYDKDRNVIEIYTKLNALSRFMNLHPQMKGYTRLTSTGRQIPMGTGAIKALTNDPEVIELFTRIDAVEQAFARAKSGSAINEGEWIKFKDELGSGALSDAAQLRTGVNIMRGSIADTVGNMWQRVPNSIRYEEQYMDRLKIFNIRAPKTLTPTEQHANDADFGAL